MISNKFIFDKANGKIAAGSLTDLEIAQLSGTQPSLDSSILKVNAIVDLPDAASNTGRMIYVIEEEKYYNSNGEEWSIDYSNDIINFFDVLSWGGNGSGGLGDGTETSRSSPVTVVGGLTNWSQVSAGGYHSLGVTTTGIAYAWGRNTQGQLGDNNAGTNRSSPVTVVGGLTNWSQVSAGGYHSLGVTTTGIAYAWGMGNNGILGDGTTSQRNSPVTVIGGITNWSQVSAGKGFSSHSLGVTTTGIAYAWGYNGNGRLGDNTVTSSRSPVTVVGGLTNWSQVSAGNSFSLGVTSTGVAYAWGLNSSGQLGTGSTTSSRSPVTLFTLPNITNWSQLSAGNSHSLGVTSTGIAYAWGSGGSGRLGDGSTTQRNAPVTVVGGITNWSQVSAGNDHSLGLTSTGVAYAWGYAGRGRLGTGNTINQSSPVTVVGGITNWSQVAAGSDHSLGIKITTKGF